MLGRLAVSAADGRRAAEKGREQAAQRRDQRAVVLPVPHPRAQPRPSWLLLPDHEVAPFRGRRQELEALLAWSECGSDGAALILVRGPAGVGKTRLLIEFARAVAGDRVVVRVRPGKEEGLVEALLVLDDPAVVVVDLKQPQPGLPALLQAAARTNGRVKVAVECRSDAWMGSTRRAMDEGDTELIDGAHRLEVHPIGSAEDLRRWHVEGTRASAQVLESEPAEGPSRSIPPGTSMLVVQAYAVVDAFNGCRSQNGRSRPAGLGDGRHPVLAEIGNYLLEHERRSWSGPTEIVADDILAQRAICLLTLLGAQDESDAASVLARVPDLTGPGNEQERRSLARWVHSLYPAAAASAWIGRLAPDLLAHALHAQVLNNPAVVDRLVDPDLTAGQLRRALSTMMPALTTFPALAPTCEAVLAASPAQRPTARPVRSALP